MTGTSSPIPCQYTLTSSSGSVTPEIAFIVRSTISSSSCQGRLRLDMSRILPGEDVGGDTYAAELGGRWARVRLGRAINAARRDDRSRAASDRSGARAG